MNIVIILGFKGKSREAFEFHASKARWQAGTCHCARTSWLAIHAHC